MPAETYSLRLVQPAGASSGATLVQVRTQAQAAVPAELARTRGAAFLHRLRLTAFASMLAGVVLVAPQASAQVRAQTAFAVDADRQEFQALEVGTGSQIVYATEILAGNRVDVPAAAIDTITVAGDGTVRSGGALPEDGSLRFEGVAPATYVAIGPFSATDSGRVLLLKAPDAVAGHVREGDVTIVQDGKGAPAGRYVMELKEDALTVSLKRERGSQAVLVGSYRRSGESWSSQPVPMRRTDWKSMEPGWGNEFLFPLLGIPVGVGACLLVFKLTGG